MSFLNDILDCDSLSPYLPVTAYEERKKLYYCDRDEAAGFILEVKPVTYGGTDYHTVLSAFINAEWPENTIIQFMMYADPNIDPILIPYRQIRENFHNENQSQTEQLLYKWSVAYADYLEHRKYNGIHSEVVPVPFRNFRAFICAKIPCTLSQITTTSVGLEWMLDNREEIVNGLETINIPCWNLTPNNYLALMFQLWNPGHPQPYCYDSRLKAFNGKERTQITWDETGQRAISEQIIAPTTHIVRKADYLRIDGWKVAVKTLAEKPVNVSLQSINDLIGDMGDANRRQITAPFLLTLNLNMNSANSVIIGKGNWVLSQKLPMMAFAKRMQKRKDELISANAVISEQGKFITGMMTLCLYAKNLKQLKSVSSSVTSLWKQKGFVLQNEKFKNLPFFMFSQPLHCCGSDMEKTKRTFIAPSSSFSYLAPLLADSNRGGRPMNVFLSRRGQIIGLDLRDSPRDYNATVVAPPGSGKSFLVNYLVQNNISTGGRNFTIEPGRSYRKLCGAFKGQYIDLTPESDISFNIFSLITPKIWLFGERLQGDVQDDKEADDIRDIRYETCLTVLYQMVSPGEIIDKDSKALVDNLAQELFNDLSIEWLKKQFIIKEFQQSLIKISTVITRNYPYYNNIDRLINNQSILLEHDQLPDILFEGENNSIVDIIEPEDHNTHGQDNDNQETVFKFLDKMIKNITDKKVKVKVFVLAIRKFINNIKILSDEDLIGLLEEMGDIQTVINNLIIIYHLIQEEKLFTIDLLIKKFNELQIEYNNKSMLNDRPESIAQRLVAFSSQGRFGKWFTGKFNIEFEKSLTSLDLEKLRRFPDLYEIITVLILSSIEYYIYIKQDKSRPTYIIIDEAAEMMTAKNVGLFIEKAYRRFRKYGACIITIVQATMDLFEKNKDISSAILTSSWKFFLNPKESDIDRAIESRIITLNRAEKNLLNGIKTKPPHYSEICLQDPDGAWSVVRLHVDRKTSLMYTTEPLEADLIERVEKQFNLDTWGAILVVVNHVELLDRTKNVQLVMDEIIKKFAEDQEESEKRHAAETVEA